jgi:hypothetical protein
VRKLYQEINQSLTHFLMWKLDFNRGIENLTALKDISPPRAAEPIAIAPESIVEALKAQANIYKERLVTSTYIGRNIKQVGNLIVPFNTKFKL